MLKIGNTRRRGCQSLNTAISKNFFVNCYSVLVSILNMLEYLRFIKVIYGFLTVDEIALKFERTLYFS